MKILPLPQTDPGRLTAWEALWDVLGPLLAVALIAIGLWLMPADAFVACYFLLLVIGFFAVYAGSRRRNKVPGTIEKGSERYSQDSFKSSGIPEELHLELRERAAKALHARNSRP